ncbi:hypothetical protein GQ53DRAFT_802609 [Thozetella sp. PMI_491]|nr:hypothetical protein GQ53DRAFT_802609 [Thozetella sp. PMI_491]
MTAIDFNLTTVRCIPPAGLTAVVEPEKADIDVVFVHGFTGHPEDTWTQKRGGSFRQSEPSTDLHGQLAPQRHKTFPFLARPDAARPDSVFWPRDLLKQSVPNARVLTYGYDSHVRHKLGASMNQSTAYDIAWDFLVALEANRRDFPERRLIFVAHSLGGIIVMETLRRSKHASQHASQGCFKSVCEATIGIIFFGTPHNGADPRTFLSSLAEKLCRFIGVQVNQRIIDTLFPSSERLRELRDEFPSLAQSYGWIIHSFQEQYSLRWLGRKVVDDWSSTMYAPAFEVAEHIGRDHRNMCRFLGMEDVEYKKFEAAFTRIVHEHSKRQSQHNTASVSEPQPGPASQQQARFQPEADRRRETLWNSLWFDQLEARRTDLARAHANTCEWFLEADYFRDWITAPHPDLLWVKGKPGSGKSTLFNFLHTKLLRSHAQYTTLTFFFHARGTDLQKSTTGMYRSLLWQLLRDHPDLCDIFNDPRFESILNTDGSKRDTSAPQWTLQLLKNIFEQTVRMAGARRKPIICLIDALDECKEDDIRDMVLFFEHIIERNKRFLSSFRICLASRHYPHITITRGLTPILEDQPGHKSDIISYVQSKLHIDNQKKSDELRQMIQEKAAGSFMWVILMVNLVNKEWDRGRTPTLQKLLDDTPEDLDSLYEDMLTRDSSNRKELHLCVLWVLFAKRPLSPDELYMAILAGLGPDPLHLAFNALEVTEEDKMRFILDCSKGIVKIVPSPEPMVQFIHESVRGFLLQKGLAHICPPSERGFEGPANDLLKYCCDSYLSNVADSVQKLHSHYPQTSKLADIRGSIKQQFPFLDYAARHVLHHAEAAQAEGVSQHAFLDQFLLSKWVDMSNILERSSRRRHSLSVSLLYILAEANHSHLIGACRTNHQFYQVEDERYGTPLHAAAVCGSRDALARLIEAESQRQPATAVLRQISTDFTANVTKCTWTSRRYKYERGPAALQPLLDSSNGLLVRFLIASRKNMSTLCDTWRDLVLDDALRRDRGSLMQLLEAGFNVQEADASARVLQKAAIHGWQEIVEKTLEGGCGGINTTDSKGLGVLSLAARAGHGTIVRTLLKFESLDIWSRDSGGKTPIMHASHGGCANTLRHLLAASAAPLHSTVRDNDILQGTISPGNEPDMAPVNEKDKFGRNSLSYAAAAGHKDLVALLLQVKGIEADVPDQYGSTPLAYAAERGHVDVVAQLLAVNAVDVNSVDLSGRTPLHCAAKDGRDEVVAQLLSDNRINSDHKDKAGFTALGLATKRGMISTVQRLEAHGLSEM